MAHLPELRRQGNDPFSSYRADFELRTYRLCQRVLMFHHFADEQDVGANCLVLLDLAGDGQLDLVDLEGPTRGFYERTHDERWETLESFESLPVIDWNNPNLKFVDLTGDGLPASQLPRQRDLIEYPVSPQQRPEPGSIVIELGGGSSLCKSMVSQETNALGGAVWSVSIPTDAISDLVAETAHGRYEYAGHFSKGNSISTTTVMQKSSMAFILKTMRTTRTPISYLRAATSTASGHGFLINALAGKPICVPEL